MPDPYMYTKAKVDQLNGWIRENTRGSGAVVEFGAGKFGRLSYVWPTARKIGIEVFPQYANQVPIDMKVIIGDFREWKRYLSDTEIDCAMFIDSLEHVSKQDGLTLLAEMKERFNKILVFAPDGYQPQDSDTLEDGNEWNSHECGWDIADLEAQGFRVEVIPEYHGPKGGALFAIWERPA